MSTPKNIESTLYEEELKQLRKKVFDKENQTARVQSELWKKNDELQHLKEASDENMAKFRAEANRVMELESELSRLNEELRSERFSRENSESLLRAVQEKVNSEEQAKRHLELELQDYASRTASQHQHDLKQLLSEKQTLESRLRVAEVKLQEERLSHSSKANLHSETIHPDVSSERHIMELQDRLSTAQKELTETSRLLSIAKRETDKNNRSQNELIAAHNARMLAETQLRDARAELGSIRERLEDQEEELNYWRETFGDKSGVRLVDVPQECEDFKKKLEISKARELALSKQLETMEARQTDLVMEKEEALNELDRLKELYHGTPQCSDPRSGDVEELRQVLEEKDTALRKSREYATELQQMYKETLAVCDTAESRVDELEKELRSLKPDPPPLIVVSPPPSKTVSRKPFLAQPTHEMTAQDEAAILKLLSAVDRLRSERDSLRRAVNFTSVEHRISTETYHGQLDEKNKEVIKLHTELETLKQQLDNATTETTSEFLKLKDEVQNWHMRYETLEFEGKNVIRAKEMDLQTMRTRLEELDTNYQRSNRALERSSRLGLASLVLVQHLSGKVEATPSLLKEDEQLRLQTTQEKGQLRAVNETLSLQVATLEDQLSEAKRDYETQDSRITSLHSEIQDLNIQVSNLQYEIKESREELLSAQIQAQAQTITEHAEGERDPSVLLSRILTLEQRVVRRTEQIGILQHDSKRLETNLRLAEETIVELTGDLEDLKRERGCLVDDCAQARKERDNVLHHLEEMEVEVETLSSSQRRQSTLEGSLERAQAEITDQTRMVESLIGVIFDFKVKLRRIGSSHMDVSCRLKTLKDRSVALEGQYAHSLAENERLALRIESMEVTLLQQTDEVDKWKQALGSTQAEIVGLLNNFEEVKSQKDAYEAEMSQQSNEQLAALETLRVELTQARQTLASSQKELESARRDEENSRHLLRSLQEDDNSKSTEVARLNSVISDLRTTIKEQTATYRSELGSLRQGFDNECSQLRSEAETNNASSSVLREEYETKIRDLEVKMTSMGSLKQAAEAVSERREAEILALMLRVEKETAAKLELQAELQGTSESITELENHIATAVSRYESDIRDLKTSLSETQSQVDEQMKTNKTLQREKNVWELEQDRLEAELQRVSTKYQYTEQQLKDSVHQLHTLEKDVQNLRTQAAKFEEAAQEAETALVSHTNQFEQKLATMQRELEKQANHRPCEEALGEFREKIEYLEEVLQMKSAEIEENDDRFIEVLKDKKRLQSKMESLDRKYRGLQSKSEGLIAKNEDLSHENGELHAKLDELSRVAGGPREVDKSAVVLKPVSRDSQPRSVTSDLPRPKTPSPVSTTPSSRPPTRIPSSPAAVLRAKTPDRDRFKKIAVPVPDLPAIPPFMVQQNRAKSISCSQTMPHLPSANTPPSSAVLSDAESSSGRKRRLPDDFDSPVRIPAQAMFACPPSERTTPPRLTRKLLGKDVKGFTPTRRNNLSQLPSSPAPVPKRAPLSEATNSPRDTVRILGLGKPSTTTSTTSAGPTKAAASRSWLNKSRMVLSKDGRSVTISGTERHLGD